MHRDRVDEVMDDPALDPAEHRRALDGLARLNRWSNAAGPIATEILRREPGSASQDGKLHVLDIACGSGDVTIGVTRRLVAAGVNASTTGIDTSPVATEAASRRASELSEDVVFAARDALGMLLPKGYDVMICSLFLHHLERDDAIRLLESMTRRACRMVVVSDLLRTRTGLFLAQLSTKTLTGSPVVRTDGPRSVRAAFTESEFRDIAADAGIGRDRLSFRRVWPQRFVASWRTDGGAK